MLSTHTLEQLTSAPSAFSFVLLSVANPLGESSGSRGIPISEHCCITLNHSRRSSSLLHFNSRLLVSGAEICTANPTSLRRVLAAANRKMRGAVRMNNPEVTNYIA